jgi:preprotein translocase subunit SecD
MKKFILVIVGFLISIYFCLSNIIDNSIYLPDNKLNLGLDIRGGLSLLIEADLSQNQQEQMTIIKNAISGKLTGQKITMKDKTLSVDGKSEDEILNAMNGIIEKKFFYISEDNGKTVVKLTEEYFTSIQSGVIDRIIDVIRYRIDATGMQEISIQKHGNDSILVQIPGATDRSDIKKILSQTGSLKFHMMDMNVSGQDIEDNLIPLGVKILPMISEDGKEIKVPVSIQPVMSGEVIADAHTGTHMGRHIVNFKLTDVGTKTFANITKNNIGQVMAIVLDNKVITAPSINEPILTGAGMISGHFSLDSANQIAILLRSGSLPVPVKIVQETLIGPTLGKEAVNKGANAVMIGCIAVIIVMIGVYGRLGIIASLALIFNLSLMLGVLSIFEATLTLPGIAGMALTLGMAVDANVLIYERMKEEGRNQHKSLMQVIKMGYERALRTIIDSNITTIIAAVLLYIFGSTTIKGFAITLIIGIICSMFTAVIVTKIIVEFWFKQFKPKKFI